MLNIKLNGIVFDEPSGFSDIKERLYYSNALSGYIIETVGAVVFTGVAYQWLRDQMRNNLCTDVVMSVDEDGHHLFDAKIFLTEIEWKPQRREASCELVYLGWMSKVDHNKKIQCIINVPRSKNDVAITVNPITDFRIPDIDNVFANDNTGKRGVYLFDAFKTLVEFMTDGEVSFRSDLFDYTVGTPTRESLHMICTGRALRDNSFATFPNISFFDLYNDCNKLFNLAFTYESDTTGNYIRIEPKLYFKKITESAYLGDVKDVTQTLDENSFPAKVTFGSYKIAKDKTYLEEYRFLTMEDEEYHLGGQCNQDTALELKLTTLITDPNIIQDVVPSGTSNDDYDKDIFIISLDPSDINRAFMELNPDGLGDYYINSFLTNEKVALRWFTNIPISIYAFLGVGGNGCFIGTSLDYIIDNEAAPLFNSRVIRGQQETGSGYHNVNGNYVQGIDAVPNGGFNVSGVYPVGSFTPVYGGFYYAPFSLVYSFEAEIFFERGTWTRVYAMVIKPPSNQVTYVELLASQLTIDPPEVFVGNGILNPNDNIHHIEISGTTYIEAGSYLCILVDSPISDVIQTGSTFEVFDPLGGRWVTYDERDNFLLENRFEYPINRELWRNIKANPNDVIGFDMGDGVRLNTWLNEITRNVRTGQSEIKLNGKL